MNKDMNEFLRKLCEKYGVPCGKIFPKDSRWAVELPSGECAALLPHRVERRFVELKKLVDTSTLEDVSTLRFANFQAGGTLKDVLARELDLAAFLAESPIVSLFATGDAATVCNTIVRFQDGKSGCLECGTALPESQKSMDRHELIARRGVASDRAVDTQVPQDSIYLWTSNGNETYTDTDLELYGLPDGEITVVRAAFALLKQPALAAEWNRAAETADKLSALALRSAETSSFFSGKEIC